MLFKCKNCGGNTVYSPEKGRMHCPHCESTDSEEKIGDDSLTQCVNCGAPLQLSEYTSACRCGHCGTYLIFDERVSAPYEPRMVLPFCVGKRMAVERMEQEFSNRLFAPSDFMSTKSLEKMEGIYVPFWLYDYDVDYDFAGEGTKVRTWTSGDTQYTETSYYEVIRKMDADFERVPVDASYVMADGIMDLMEPIIIRSLRILRRNICRDFSAKDITRRRTSWPAGLRIKSGKPRRACCRGRCPAIPRCTPIKEISI